MPFVLDIRTLGEGKAHPVKNPDGAIEHLGERMNRADVVRRTGERNVDLGEGAGFAGATEFLTRGLQRGGDRGTDLVQELAHDRSLLF